MATVEELTLGDAVRVPGGSGVATFVQQAQHPIWPKLRLVMWRLPDGSWSHDALDARQDVGPTIATSQAGRERRLYAALCVGR